MSANCTLPKHWQFFVILTLKILIWWNLLEKRDAFYASFTTVRYVRWIISAPLLYHNSHTNAELNFFSLGHFFRMLLWPCTNTTLNEVSHLQQSLQQGPLDPPLKGPPFMI